MRNAHCRTWNTTRKRKNRGKRETYIIGFEIWQETLKNVKKGEIERVGPGLWRENRKTWKMRHKHCRTWNIVRNPEKHKKMKMHFLGLGLLREN
jgi:hypothetical protein